MQEAALRLEKDELLAQHIHAQGPPTNLWLCEAWGRGKHVDSLEAFCGRRFLIEFGDEAIQVSDRAEPRAWELFYLKAKQRTVELIALRGLITSAAATVGWIEQSCAPLDASRFAGAEKIVGQLRAAITSAERTLEA